MSAIVNMGLERLLHCFSSWPCGLPKKKYSELRFAYARQRRPALPMAPPGPPGSHPRRSRGPLGSAVNTAADAVPSVASWVTSLWSQSHSTAPRHSEEKRPKVRGGPSASQPRTAQSPVPCPAHPPPPPQPLCWSLEFIRPVRLLC